MPAVAEVMSTTSPNQGLREWELPTCPVCADSMIAAEASVLLSDDVVSHLWTCDTCGYGFVTNHTFRAIPCN